MLFSLTQPNFPNAAIGIECHSVSAIALTKHGRSSYSVKQAATIGLANGVIDPSFLEINITDPHEFRASLEAAVQASGLLNQKRWSIALPSNSARSAILTLDAEPVAKQETEEILDWKAEQTFGAPAAQLRIARQKISPNREGRPRYFATAIALGVIDEYETLFESMGWKAGLILPRAVGEANWLLDRAVFRLLMFYNDRFGANVNEGYLDRVLLIGRDLVPERITKIAAEALGRSLVMLRPEDVGLSFPESSFNFDEIAAPAALAALA